MCIFVQTRPLEGITKIGEPLSILIFLSDQGEGRFNVKAQVPPPPCKTIASCVYHLVYLWQDCWAYDSEYFEDSTTTKVQLTTRDGCPVYVNPPQHHTYYITNISPYIQRERPID